MRKLISLIIILCAIDSYGQNIESAIDAIINRKNTNGIVIESITPELSIIRQQYRLKLKEDYYGKNNMPYYGEKYCLGIKVGGGLMFLSNIVKPWEGDADFERVTAKRLSLIHI